MVYVCTYALQVTICVQELKGCCKQLKRLKMQFVEVIDWPNFCFSGVTTSNLVQLVTSKRLPKLAFLQGQEISK